MHSHESDGFFEQIHKGHQDKEYDTCHESVVNESILKNLFIWFWLIQGRHWISRVLDEFFSSFKYYNCDNSFQLTFSKYSLDPSGVGLIWNQNRKKTLKTSFHWCEIKNITEHKSNTCPGFIDDHPDSVLTAIRRGH